MWRYHQASKGHLKISRQGAGHFVVEVLVILGWQIAYKRGTQMQKPTPEMDALGHWPLTTVQCIHFHSWINSSIWFWIWLSSNSWQDFVRATLCLHICIYLQCSQPVRQLYVHFWVHTLLLLDTLPLCKILRKMVRGNMTHILWKKLEHTVHIVSRSLWSQDLSVHMVSRAVKCCSHSLKISDTLLT